MNNIDLLSSINLFPIGPIPQNRNELLSKVEVISFLSRYQGQFSAIENIDEREQSVRTFLSKVVELEDEEEIPSLEQAEKNLNLSFGFLKDFGKVQYVKESNLEFDRTYDLIASNLGLLNKEPIKLK